MGSPTPRAFDRLNPAQRQAATHGAPGPAGGFHAGPLLIVAGAGTGKTATLAHRVAHLVTQGVDPARILMLTFTRRAAQEMVRRTEAILAETAAQTPGGAAARALAARLGWAGTFHSIGNRILRLYARQLGLDPAFTVLDRSDAADLIDVLREELGLSRQERRFPRKDSCLAIYSYRVNTGWPLARAIADLHPWAADREEDLRGLFRAYVLRKQRLHVLDFDDLLLCWHAMMQSEALARDLGQRFDHLLVDEFQDTSRLQGEILQALKPDGAGVTVVGDDAQAIYSFRAASVDNILGFPDHYRPRAEVILLTENYRSTQPILDAANALIAEGERQHRKVLGGGRRSSQKPRYVVLDDAVAQATYVADRILAARESGVALRRNAVLFRSSHHSDVLEVELARRRIPFVKYGGLKFLDAAHVKDLLSVLRFADNPRNAVSGFRVLKLLPGIGPAIAQRALAHLEAREHSIGALATFAAPPSARIDFAGFCDVLRALADPNTPWPGQVGLARRWYEPQLDRLYEASRVRLGDLEQLEQLSTRYATRERFLSELALDPPAATGDWSRDASKDEDYVVLSTIHSAKGQEWDQVFVLNVADGNFPSEFAAGKPEALDEERRLLYVAITRARNELHLCAPLRYAITQQSRTGDAHVYGAKSRFLTDAVLACFEQISMTPPTVLDASMPGDGPMVDVVARMNALW
ncbi:MAG: ATP-dependent helicase [Gammaproteobacteria bacterium]|nr:ATP-dependent helicase [Gammaproteobacteria bacterium]